MDDRSTTTRSSEISRVCSYNWFIVVEKNTMDMFIKVFIASQNMQIGKCLLIPFCLLHLTLKTYDVTKM